MKGNEFGPISDEVSESITLESPQVSFRDGPIVNLKLEDIGVLTSGQLITEEKGLSMENLQLEQLGTARRVIVTKDSTTIINEGTKNEVQQQVVL